MSQNLNILLSDYLSVDLEEVKEVIKQMSLADLMAISDAIRDDDREKVFNIYNGYLIWKS